MANEKLKMENEKPANGNFRCPVFNLPFSMVH
jgi:hypothetical protein